MDASIDGVVNRDRWRLITRPRHEVANLTACLARKMLLGCRKGTWGSGNMAGEVGTYFHIERWARVKAKMRIETCDRLQLIQWRRRSL